MFCTNRSRIRRGTVTVLVLTLMASALSTGVAGASRPAADKVDKAAVLRFGVPFEDQGGPFFDPNSPKATANPTPRLWLDLIYGTMIVETTDGKGAPGLATAWTAPDAQTVELTLRDGVKFSDGTPFNADAVVAAWTALINGNRPNKGTNGQSFVGVEKIADNKVRMKFNAPVAQNFINTDLKSANYLGVPSPAAAAKGNLDSAPLGAGPYLFDGYNTGKVVLKRNPDYYDKKLKTVGEIDYIDTPIGPPAVSALQAGTVDLIWSFPPDAVQTLQSSPGIEVYSAPSPRQFQLSLCPTQGVFANQKARQAMQYAIDRDAINEAALSGTGAPGTLILASNNPFYDKKLAKTVKYDPKKAKALLKEAGVAEGTKVTMLVPAQPPYDAMADVIQPQLEAVGLAPEITKTTSYATDAARLKPDMATVSLDPNLFNLVFKGENPLNFCAWNDPAVIAAMEATQDPTKSEADLKQAWADFQKIALEQSANIATNAQGVLAAYSDKVKNMTIVNAPYGPQLYGVYMTK
ncbi:MAG: ABC transporter substrate-binding protein [Actinobacteria bacterium]|nr:ABC transporter substrate-binding protein [Actinomycetota bacterium]